MANKVLVLNNNDFNSGYGGQATFIKNLHPYLSEAFELKYLIVPWFFIRHHKIPLRLVYLIQVWLYMLFNRKNYDLIISHTPEASYIVSLFNKPFIHIFHGNKNALTNSIFFYGKYFKWVFDLIDKKVIKKATKLYTVGESRENAEKFNNPINLPASKIALPAERKDFVFAGRLEKMKNIDSIIEVYNALPDKYKINNKLNIIGTGTQWTKLKNLVTKLNLDEKVIFHGQISNDKSIAIINNSLILLMASSYEGFPMVIAESLSLGTPVISTNVGDIASVIVD
jgi:glycosyltransferase involved in cell wall biosynthesis